MKVHLEYDISVFSYEDYVSFLEDVYLDIREKKGSFSQRDFGKALGLSAPRVNQIINRKEGLSVKKAMDMASVLDFGQAEKEYFYHLVASKTTRCQSQRNSSRKFISENFCPLGQNYQSYEKWSLLDLDGWNIIWNLIDLKEGYNTTQRLTEVSGIQKYHVDNIILKMVDLNLVKLVEGKITKLTSHIAFGNSVSSKNIQIFHRNQGFKAIKALEEPVEQRKFESITFTMNKKDYAELGNKIEKFIDSITTDLNEDNHDEVVSVNVALFKEVRTS